MPRLPHAQPALLALLTALATIAIVAASGDVAAYETMTTSQGTHIVWMHDEVGFFVDASGTSQLAFDEVEQAVDDSLGTWNGVPDTDVALVFEGAVSGRDIGYQGSDDINLVAFFDTDWRFDDNALAITLSTWKVPSGELLDADIAVNASDYDWAVDGRSRHYDLAAALTHELGHAVGLGHSDERHATMYASMAPAEVAKRDLHADDMAGYQYLYGNADVITPPSTPVPSNDDSEPAVEWPTPDSSGGGSSNGVPAGDVSFGCSAAQGSGGGPMSLLVGVFLAALGGRLRRRFLD